MLYSGAHWAGPGEVSGAALEPELLGPGRLLEGELGATSCGARVLPQRQRALAWYRARGIVCQRVLTDNGSGYVSRVFRHACQAAGLRHLRTRPHTPRTNGKAERFVQTLLREWAYARRYATSQERRATLRPRVRYYNRERPYASLGYQPPLTRLRRAA